MDANIRYHSHAFSRETLSVSHAHRRWSCLKQARLLCNGGKKASDPSPLKIFCAGETPTPAKRESEWEISPEDWEYKGGWYALCSEANGVAVLRSVVLE